jgi:hypothetical protein
MLTPALPGMRGAHAPRALSICAAYSCRLSCE